MAAAVEDDDDDGSVHGDTTGQPVQVLGVNLQCRRVESASKIILLYTSRSVRVNDPTTPVVATESPDPETKDKARLAAALLTTTVEENDM